MSQTSNGGTGADGNGSDARRTEEMPRRGPAGDARPDFDGPDPRTRGGQPQEDVEDRGTVGTVEPDDYPQADRRDSRPTDIPSDPAGQAPAEGGDDVPPPTPGSPQRSNGGGRP